MVCGIAAVVLGGPLAVLVTPLVVLVLAPVAATLPASLGFAAALRAFASSFDRALASEEWRAIAMSVVAMMLPGMVAMVGLWLGLRRLFGATGGDVVALALEAREPRPGDLEERQLVNVVEEMAIAAGVAPPAVKLLDVDAANAAAVDGGTVLVTRGVLDALDRAETQAVAAHLLGSLVNGDAKLSASVYAVHECTGLLLTVLDAVFGLSPSALRELGATLRFVSGGRGDARAAGTVARLLGRSRGEPREDGFGSFMEDVGGDAPRTRFGRAVKRAPFLWALLVPFLLVYVVSLLLAWQVYLLRVAIVEPTVRLLWRSRRFLADAVAVQLTREPDALKSALERLGPASAAAPWTDALFIVGGSEKALLAAHPSLDERRRRLSAMGASGGAPVEAKRRPKLSWAAGLVAAAVLVPLFVIGGSLALYVLGMSFLLALAPAVLLTAGALTAIASFLP